ncbi:MAG: hypothetical protein HY052_00400 [Proteobacteria bacterium]|nr:hypothetical protein [Pseudomonadota bacterium]
MDHLACEILETIEAFRKQGRPKMDSTTGKPFSRVQLGNELFQGDVDIPDWSFLQPPVDFEMQHHLTKIAQHYHLPEGLSPDNLQTYALLLTRRKDMSEAARLDKMTAICDALIVANPALQRLQCDTARFWTAYHVVMGVASAFNIDDIQHFLNGQGKPEPAGVRMENSLEFKSLTSVFNRYAAARHMAPDLDMFWVASPTTLQNIRDQFVKKRSKPAAAHPRRKAG